MKKNFANIKLHLVGKLQTNKVKYVVDLFDYIHSVDNIKLAMKISNELKKIIPNELKSPLGAVVGSKIGCDAAGG